jgi:hypothetical protein
MKKNPLERVYEIKTQNQLLLTYNKPKEIMYHQKSNINENIWDEEKDFEYTVLKKQENVQSIIPRRNETSQNLLDLFSNSIFKNIIQIYLSKFQKRTI